MTATETGLSPHALLTYQEATRFMKVDRDTELGDMVRLMVNGITERFERYIGGPIAARPFVKTLDGTGAVVMFLDPWPIVRVKTVTVLNNDGTVDTALDPATDVWVQSSPGRLVVKPEAPRGFPYGVQNIRVEWVAGFDPIPADIKMAAGTTLRKLYRDWDRDRDDVASVAVEGQTITYQLEELPRPVRGTLDRYVNPRGAA